MINLENQLVNITKSYREAVNDVDIKVRNEALQKAFKEGYSEGWIAATLWIDERKGPFLDKAFITENVEAKYQAIDDIFGPELKWGR